ncbi:metalloregulator ArsR/SmtB family transcription factor [Brevibacterium casei]|uniref:ArsR/SmtB family transcription factor n=1 Tax=Brevibacterium casei TaxID=33889 RepID=UPI003158DC4B
MTDLFKAIADPTRRTILDELAERDDQTLFEICSRLANRHGLGLSRQAVSQHLEVLESAGLVVARREGRYKFHRLDPEPLRTAFDRWTGGQQAAAQSDGTTRPAQNSPAQYSPAPAIPTQDTTDPREGDPS